MLLPVPKAMGRPPHRLRNVAPLRLRTSMRVLSISRCSGPWQPQNGMFTFLAARELAEIRYRPVQPSKSQQAFNETCRLPERQSKENFIVRHVWTSASLSVRCRSALPTKSSLNRTRAPTSHGTYALRYRLASSGSCRKAGSNCSYPLAITLDCQLESRIRFVQWMAPLRNWVE